MGILQHFDAKKSELNKFKPKNLKLITSGTLRLPEGKY